MKSFLVAFFFFRDAENVGPPDRPAFILSGDIGLMVAIYFKNSMWSKGCASQPASYVPVILGCIRVRSQKGLLVAVFFSFSLVDPGQIAFCSFFLFGS